MEQLVKGLTQTATTVNNILSAYGIRYYPIEIILNPEGHKNAILIIYKLEADSEQVINVIREEFRKTYKLNE